MQTLSMAFQVQVEEVAQSTAWHSPMERQLEVASALGGGVAPGLLANSDHKLPCFGIDEHQLTAHGKIAVRQLNIPGIPRIFGRPGVLRRPVGTVQQAGLPNAHHLQVKLVLVLVTIAGVAHPEMGLVQVHVPPHQMDHAAEKNGFQPGVVHGVDDPGGQGVRTV